MKYETLEIMFLVQIQNKCLGDKMRSFLLNPFNLDSDRILYVTKYLEEFNLIPQLTKTCKNNNVSVQYRNKGNTAFRADDLENARILYTKSLAYAETDKSTECLAVAYANRSAVLYQMAHYKECIQDIEKSLELDYPHEKKEKLLLRKSKAELLKAPIKQYKFYNDIISNDIAGNTKNKIQIMSNTKQECFAVATQDIDPGELISIEEPYITCMNRCSFDIMSFCFNCSNFTLNLIPCDQCPFALFCDENCKQKAWYCHQYECPLMQTLYDLNLSGEDLLTLRIVIFSMVNDLQNIIKLMEKRDGNYMFGYINENEHGIMELQSNYAAIHYSDPRIEKRSPHEYLQRCLMASVLWNLLKQSQLFRTIRLLNEDKVGKLVASLLIRHANSYKFYSQKIFSLLSAPNVMFTVGMGVYPFYGLLSHSCDPNVFEIFYGRKLILRALNPIKKGERLWGNCDPK